MEFHSGETINWMGSSPSVYRALKTCKRAWLDVGTPQRSGDGGVHSTRWYVRGYTQNVW